MLATVIAYQLVGGGGRWELRGAGMPKNMASFKGGKMHLRHNIPLE